MKTLLPLRFRQSGQAILIVLLIMAVILTVALSVISRSVTDISVTSLDEEALRAFSAAEAGVERALIVGTDVTDTVGGSSFNAVVSGLADGAPSFAYPTEIYSGESVYIWFVSHDEGGDLVCNSPSLPCFTGSSASFCWAAQGTGASEIGTPAIEVSVFYDPALSGVATGNFSAVRVGRATFDPNVSRRLDNNFSPDQGACLAGGENFAFSGDINFGPDDSNPSSVDLGITCLGSNGCLLVARVRALYNTGFTHPIGIDVTPATLPAQGRKIDSTGTSESGESVRKIEAYRTFGGPPPIFDASVFSQGSVIK
jgi:type II secretory pathway pseudopilin PulG